MYIRVASSVSNHLTSSDAFTRDRRLSNVSQLAHTAFETGAATAKPTESIAVAASTSISMLSGRVAAAYFPLAFDQRSAIGEETHIFINSYTYN